MKKEKNKLRERILALLSNQKEEERLKKSLQAAVKLYRTQEFKEAKVILFYASFDGEVDTFEMMKQAQKADKIVALPCVDMKFNTMIPRIVKKLEDLKVGSYGIKEPDKKSTEVDLKNIDLVIVPGVAFDRNNNRLGRGGGYYDRFLKKLPKGKPSIGLAFDFQIVDEIPSMESHDKAVSFFLTN